MVWAIEYYVFACFQFVSVCFEMRIECLKYNWWESQRPYRLVISEGAAHSFITKTNPFPFKICLFNESQPLPIHIVLYVSIIHTYLSVSQLRIRGFCCSRIYTVNILPVML